MYYLKFIELINLILDDRITLDALNDMLMNEFDCENIYNAEDDLITDTYFTLKHFAIGEDEVPIKEWKYLKSCLEGKQIYSLIEKMSQ